jgi:hypothetical protein
VGELILVPDISMPRIASSLTEMAHTVTVGKALHMAIICSLARYS